NPAQLRRVTRKLNQHHYLATSRGRFGGCQATDMTANVNLSELFVMCKEDRSEGRLFTGDAGSDCEVSGEIGNTMFKFHQKEEELLINEYRTAAIQGVLNETSKDVLNETSKEDYYEKV